ncbi:Uncharacterized protein C2orf78-like [Cricetulus griseus]|uniref:Uncharacterized protein C2orf78-like n=1 Tax=Cricetulus griseus TaxID=10029 RepID=G3INR5_CRIGR|nr:Uncharacterized protein C2orf78-like [Cricetulus griseus]
MTLTPAPSLEETGKNNMEEMTAEPWMPMKAFECIKDNQHATLSYLAQPGMQQPLKYTDDGSLRQKLASDDSTLGSTSFGLEEPGTLQSVMVSSIDFEDMTTLVSDIHLPQLLNSITDLIQLEDLTATQSTDFGVFRSDQAQESSSRSIFTFKEENKKDQKDSDLLHGVPQARIQCQILLEGEDALGIATASEGAIDNMVKHLDGTAQKSAHSRPRISRTQGQDKTKKTRGKKNKKTRQLKSSCP